MAYARCFCPLEVQDAYELMGYGLLDRKNPYAMDVVNFFLWSCTERYDVVIVTHQDPIMAASVAGYDIFGFSCLPLYGVAYRCSPDAAHKEGTLLKETILDHIDNVCKKR